jgi:hypothetical protein
MSIGGVRGLGPAARAPRLHRSRRRRDPLADQGVGRRQWAGDSFRAIARAAPSKRHVVGAWASSIVSSLGPGAGGSAISITSGLPAVATTLHSWTARVAVGEIDVLEADVTAGDVLAVAGAGDADLPELLDAALLERLGDHLDTTGFH